MLTYLFEKKLSAVSFDGCGVRPEIARLFGFLFVHVNCRNKVCCEEAFPWGWSRGGEGWGGPGVGGGCLLALRFVCFWCARRMLLSGELRGVCAFLTLCNVHGGFDFQVENKYSSVISPLCPGFLFMLSEGTRIKT